MLRECTPVLASEYEPDQEEEEEDADDDGSGKDEGKKAGGAAEGGSKTKSASHEIVDHSKAGSGVPRHAKEYALAPHEVKLLEIGMR